MGLILFIFNIILTLNIISKAIIDDIYKQVDIIAYLNDDADIFTVNMLIEDIKSIKSVTDVEYTTKEEALEDYLSIYPDQGNPFDSYGLENPLPANIQITTTSPEDHQAINSILEEKEYASLLMTTVDNSENQSLADKVLAIGTYTKNLVLLIMLIFIITSFIIILNAMHLTIYTRSKEIEIMQLVGAPIRFIKWPFIIEGMAISLSAALISLFLILTFIANLNMPIAISELADLGKLGIIATFQVIISIFIGVFSSNMAIERHLRRS
ncbi:hypothetical protein A2344_04710 [Candidatus Peregrinibacteria bacterium RIFOXYB12_FULL_41_12]|nr:MAG: hypothetical protein A2344_04710 [Candidatus Peregrinibacteria bacterium RIFOXYB12_FULL_41_12]OGJ48664.1 MAG: hypothetical protein A2244_03135 [Candidatus Peregrinibacteria bacterium RIFOXYA2_FULL_41_18]OGJ52454.1 MAG: hypothetical protein A2448_03555 [Candidatus Peregrinibacteria bacterium RIFOXYC2_FULL_41_22]OGJ55299.1 MAG: hypothetical protein A2336_01110 [Candidatus Peregrinibacteria bacterium RIFOXYB2_FULL_41_88]